MSNPQERTLFDSSCLETGDMVWASYHPSWSLLCLAKVIEVTQAEVLLEFEHNRERGWRNKCAVRLKIGDGA
jgi:hypothetical protein